jgi:DNA-binding XRE family transcriptional regulator
MVNLDNISFIEDSHGKKAVILSMETYQEIKEQLEELEDIESYIKSKGEKEETFPLEMVERLLLGEGPKIKAMREYRGYSLTALAKLIGISEAYLSQIENQKRKGSIEVYRKLAEALNVEIDMLT